jgi:ABC-type transport system substrate-binding protein
VRATDYNRFQEKVRTGNAQILTWGWNADYPDPDNFLFLLHGPQSKVSAQGENAANYANAEFDRLFEEMKHMPNSDRRQAIIDQMITILREDAPWLWGIHPKSFGLYHEWIGNVKPNQMARNNLKYQRVDAARRAIQRRDWNEPILFPMLLAGALAVLFVVPAVLAYRRRERMSAR